MIVVNVFTSVDEDGYVPLDHRGNEVVIAWDGVVYLDARQAEHDEECTYDAGYVNGRHLCQDTDPVSFFLVESPNIPGKRWRRERDELEELQAFAEHLREREARKAIFLAQMTDARRRHGGVTVVPPAAWLPG